MDAQTRETKAFANMKAFLDGRSVAVFGATETLDAEGKKKLGQVIAENLTATFRGDVYPINPKADRICGKKAYKNLNELPETPDLAVVVTPPMTVPGIVDACAKADVKAMIIITAGLTKEQKVEIRKRRRDMRIVGPNCLGVMTPRTGFNGTFAAEIAQDGTVAVLSQSGAVITAMHDWSLWIDAGYRCLFSLGDMLDVGWRDLLFLLESDAQTRSIVIYMESIGDARDLVSAAREVSREKPIFVIRPGRTPAAQKAAASHTGALAGEDAIAEVVFIRGGIVRVDRTAEAFYAAYITGLQPLPRGPRLAILTNAGGPAVLATDVYAGRGGTMAELPPETMEALDKALPPTWSRRNPVDIIGDAGYQRYYDATRIALASHGFDALLVIFTYQAMTPPEVAARAIANAYQESKTDKMVISAFLGGKAYAVGQSILAQVGVPVLPYSDSAAAMVRYLCSCAELQEAMYQTPRSVPHDEKTAPRLHAQEMLRRMREEGRTTLSESDAKEVLAAYGVPVNRIVPARTEAEAAQIALVLGGQESGVAGSMAKPVVVKVLADLPETSHKSEFGVHLNLTTEAEVRKAFRDVEARVSERIGQEFFHGVSIQPMVATRGVELILGAKADSQAGPVMLFGEGGTLVEVHKDIALELPPITTSLARRLISRTRIGNALLKPEGIRGLAIDTTALEEILVRFSYFIAENPQIAEIDINPLLASTDGFMALDARIALHAKGAELPHLAIRPYPTEYIRTVISKSGRTVLLRPIEPSDEPLLFEMHRYLGRETVSHRYGAAQRRELLQSHMRLARRCFIDYRREFAQVAVVDGKIVGVGRLLRHPDGTFGETAFVVEDPYQGDGIGTRLLEDVLRYARDEGMAEIEAVLIGIPDPRMQKILEKADFKCRHEEAGGTVCHRTLRSCRPRP
jgi:acetyltransferase